MNKRLSHIWENLKRPRPLQPGNAVAVLAPASPLKRGQRSTVNLSLSLLQNRGLIPRLAPGLWSRRGYLAGMDEHRAKQLLWAFEEDEIRGIFCLRGGYGSMRILPLLDQEIFRENPKVFVGFSDLTAILLYLLGIGGMVVFHGPTLTSQDLSRGPQSATSRSLFRAVLEGLVPEPITGEGWGGGTAQGLLVGGCLSIMTSLLGTPFFPPLKDAILFLEDVDEPLYRIDRMLHHLLLSGVLEEINGLVLGAMASGERKSQLREVMRAVLSVRDIPVLFGAPCGHGGINLTLPMGTPVRLDGDRGVLYFLQCGVEGAR